MTQHDWTRYRHGMTNAIGEDIGGETSGGRGNGCASLPTDIPEKLPVEQGVEEESYSYTGVEGFVLWCKLLSSAAQSIRGAMYMITHHEIIKRLIAACQRGVSGH